MNVAYVVVSNGRDRYAAMAYLSAASVLRLHPDWRVFLVCDEATPARLRAGCPELAALAADIIGLPVSVEHPSARGFYLKTRVRDVVPGDFVFLDADTLPVRPFADIADGDWELAIGHDYNHHRPLRLTYPHWLESRLERVGWPGPLDRSYNSGVVFYRDTPAVWEAVADQQRLFAELLAVGDRCDQTPLTYALRRSRVRVRELPAAYNAMVTVSPLHARGAKIYHFFAGSFTTLEGSLYQHLLDHFDAHHAVDWAAVDRCVAIDHPWMPPYWPRRLWQTGNRALAVRHFAANLPGRLARSLRRPAAPGGPGSDPTAVPVHGGVVR